MHPALHSAVTCRVLALLQFQTSAADLTASNPELADAVVLSPGTQVKLPPV